MGIENDKNKTHTPSLVTAAETRQFVTPYAFTVADRLLGLPLATPSKRALCIAIDLLIIALLTQLTGIILVAVLALMFYRAGSKSEEKSVSAFARRIFRFFAVTLLLIFFGWLLFVENENFFDAEIQMSNESPVSLNSADDFTTLVLAAKYGIAASDVNSQIDSGKCDFKLTCWQPLIEKLIKDVSESDLDENQLAVILEVVTEKAGERLNPEELGRLMSLISAGLDGRYPKLFLIADETSKPASQAMNDENIGSDASDETLPSTEDSATLAVTKVLPMPTNATQMLDMPKETKENSPGLIAWFKTIAADLGLGFGWAAVYFTVFTAWWNGQTPAKRLLGIRVVQLNGEVLGLWASFERYGGYGAGLATGLLGFLQIYWDANRMTIQDKISETVVIDVNKQIKKGV